MDRKLMISAVTKFLAGLVLLALLIFLPAGTLAFTQGWIFMAVLFLPMLIIGIVLALKSPELLRKRLNSKEQENTQKGVVISSLLMFLGGFITAGLSFRFGWLRLPMWVSITAAVIFLIGYAMYAEVLRENEYLSRTVEVQEEQKVIDTGLYGVIRHPMYTATILMFCFAPLVLGSVISFVIFLAYPVIIVTRIGNEEKVLEQGLKGYSDYKKKVRYRLLPFVW
ncbi:isoprenylcysteine carboxyl methyltransferase [Ruminococcus albus SY3]|uniref:Isoprenylcysteine carboxyl methyltransferase n=1 Tax=Ruminococcus albus SY3 TaxID=1341156 RepID=A0A011VYQ6_RUMAL|nr:isoprenylcysteine carboxylmethyltransferase family protein [Ruminococcus albus]EXM39708.1 isoprenylcysteine carboxyl methyltransferase [Ruminococcus albus SY3]